MGIGGYRLRIYDRNVSLARLVGANRDYINGQIPHLSSLLCDTMDEVLDHSDLIVVGNAAPEGEVDLGCERERGT